MNGKKKARIPVLAPVLSIVIDQDSPDLVLNDFMAVGFDSHLPLELEAGYGPRKRAYVAVVQGWIDDLEGTSQWELARALRYASTKIGRNLCNKGSQAATGVSMAHNLRQLSPSSMPSFGGSGP